MFVYSGPCRLCETGIKTPHKDRTGKDLFTGDIVLTYTKDYGPNELTVIVQDKDGFYAMGIKSVMTEHPDLDDPDALECWKVMKVKDHSEVVPGERWKAFGFRYQS